MAICIAPDWLPDVLVLVYVFVLFVMLLLLLQRRIYTAPRKSLYTLTPTYTTKLPTTPTTPFQRNCRLNSPLPLYPTSRQTIEEESSDANAAPIDGSVQASGVLPKKEMGGGAPFSNLAFFRKQVKRPQ